MNFSKYGKLTWLLRRFTTKALLLQFDDLVTDIVNSHLGEPLVQNVLERDQGPEAVVQEVTEGDELVVLEEVKALFDYVHHLEGGAVLRSSTLINTLKL